MEKQCPCGEIIFVKPYLIHRKKYCSKPCQYKYHTRPKGLKYKITKVNPTAFKKGQTPWNKGLRDEKTNGWKGDEVGYDGVHGWVERHLGKPKKCEFCKSTKKGLYHWSNKDHKYKRNLSDYQRLCVRCHFYYDKKTFGTRESFHR